MNLTQASNLLVIAVVVVVALVWAGADRLVRRSAHRATGAAQARVVGPGALETIERLDAVLIDPVGTITAGELSVVSVEPLDPAHDRNLRWFAGALQHTADDPVAKAIARLATRGRVTDVEHLPGVGTIGAVDRHPVRVGRPDWIGVEAPDDGWGSTVAVEVDGRAMGRITVADTFREQAPDATAAIAALGLRVVVLAGSEAMAARAQSALDACEIRQDDPGDDQGCLAVLGRGRDSTLRWESGDLAISDGPTEAPVRVELADVAVHHVAAALRVLRGAAAKVRLVRRSALVVAAFALVGIAVAPSLVADALIALAGLVAVGLVATVPLVRWR